MIIQHRPNHFSFVQDVDVMNGEDHHVAVLRSMDSGWLRYYSMMMILSLPDVWLGGET
jgi:hypothetical protein